MRTKPKKLLALKKDIRPEKIILKGLFIERTQRYSFVANPPGFPAIRRTCANKQTFRLNASKMALFLNRFRELIVLQDASYRLACQQYLPNIEMPAFTDWEIYNKGLDVLGKLGSKEPWSPELHKAQLEFQLADTNFKSQYREILNALIHRNGHVYFFAVRYFPRTASGKKFFWDFVGLWDKYIGYHPGENRGRTPGGAALTSAQKKMILKLDQQNLSPQKISEKIWPENDVADIEHLVARVKRYLQSKRRIAPIPSSRAGTQLVTN